MVTNQIYSEAVDLLKQLIATPSLSRQEEGAVEVVKRFFSSKNLDVHQKGNNLWVWAEDRNHEKPTILLNSHLDTVKPSASWSLDPYNPVLQDGRLYGLGSNDAGASLVSLMAAFLVLAESKQPYNLVMAATAEEEVSGLNGVSSILDDLGVIDLGIVGEPTQMQMAIAEKGLLVLDCKVQGKAGHAARNEGDNAIYKALPIIEWFQNHRFAKESDLFGPVKMSVTGIKAGSQHNVVPDVCEFMVDIRLNEQYSNKELFQLIDQEVDCEVKPRSFRLNSSCISASHPVVQRGKQLGATCYGSPTTSDQAVMNFTTLKIGPGDSARSHTADEYIELEEIRNGITTYVKLLDQLVI
jgi:acetylornithine deacetylase